MLTSSASVTSEWTRVHFSLSKKPDLQKNHEHRHWRTKHLPAPNRFCSLGELLQYQCTCQVSRPHMPINNLFIGFLSFIHSISPVETGKLTWQKISDEKKQFTELHCYSCQSKHKAAVSADLSHRPWESKKTARERTHVYSPQLWEPNKANFTAK